MEWTFLDTTKMRGVTPGRRAAFHRAATLFYESQIWRGLSATQHREFAIFESSSAATRPSFDDFDGPDGPPDYTQPAPRDASAARYAARDVPIGQPVTICGIQSAQHAHHNGRRGEIFGRFDDAAGRFPVRACADGAVIRLKPSCLRVDLARDRQLGIVKINGADGQHGGSIHVYTVYGDLFQGRDRRTSRFSGHADITTDNPCLMCQFYDPAELRDTHLHRQVQNMVNAHRRLRPPVPLPDCPSLRTAEGGMRNVFFPLPGVKNVPRPNHTHLELLEVAFMAAVKFLPVLFTKPSPPPPHPRPYTFEKTTFSMEVHPGLSVTCCFPAGELDMVHRRYGSYPGLVQHYAARDGRVGDSLKKVCTIGDCIEFHRAGVAALELETFGDSDRSTVSKMVASEGLSARLREILFEERYNAAPNLCADDEEEDNDVTAEAVRVMRAERVRRMAEPRRDYKHLCLMGHVYGLANALWESEQLPNVREALDLAEDVLNADPQDARWQIKEFLLDVMLEVGAWERLVKLLNRFPNLSTEAWLWSSAFVYFKARGADSKLAHRALERAMEFNPCVIGLLLGTVETTRSANRAAGMHNAGGISIGHMANGRSGVIAGRLNPFAEANANAYVRNFKKHWHNDKPAFAWLQAAEALMKKREKKRRAKANKKKKQQESATAQKHHGTFIVNPDQVVAPAASKLALCSRCGALGGAVDPDTGVHKKLMKCPCLLVAYCSVKCQRAAWKGHKAACKAAVSAKAKAIPLIP